MNRMEQDSSRERKKEESGVSVKIKPVTRGVRKNRQSG